MWQIDDQPNWIPFHVLSLGEHQNARLLLLRQDAHKRKWMRQVLTSYKLNKSHYWNRPHIVQRWPLSWSSCDASRSKLLYLLCLLWSVFLRVRGEWVVSAGDHIDWKTSEVSSKLWFCIAAFNPLLNGTFQGLSYSDQERIWPNLRLRHQHCCCQIITSTVDCRITFTGICIIEQRASNFKSQYMGRMREWSKQDATKNRAIPVEYLAGKKMLKFS
jgi:hypothetical protein